MGIAYYKYVLFIALALGLYSRPIGAQERYAAIDPDAVAEDQMELAVAPQSFEAAPDPIVLKSAGAEETAQKKSTKKALGKIEEREAIRKEEGGRSKAPLTEEDVAESSNESTMSVEVSLSENKKRVTYDIVPNPQREAFVERMELARRILMKTGRAYDYRTVTLTELRTIAKSLKL